MYSNTYLITSIRNYLILMMFQFTELTTSFEIRMDSKKWNISMEN